MRISDWSSDVCSSDLREKAEREGNFRQLTQAERLQDARMNPAAKQVAAIDAAIEQKYGADSPEPARMKVAAREAIAQTLERGAFVARRAFARSNRSAARHAPSSAPPRIATQKNQNDRRRAVWGAPTSTART